MEVYTMAKTKKKCTTPWIYGKRGITFAFNLESLTVGKLHLINGELEKALGVKVSFGVMVRRAISMYFDYIQNKVKVDGSWEDELEKLALAGNRDPEVIKQKLGIAKKADGDGQKGD
jgi:hypothetical protein